MAAVEAKITRPIRVINRQRRLRLHRPAICSLAALVLEAESVPAGTGVTLVFVRDTAIREYNRRYLGHDYATDVISFPAEDQEQILPGEDRSTGDILISVDRAAAYGGQHGIPAAEELSRYIIHGILHCRGYDDRDTVAKHHMQRRQEQLLRRWLTTGNSVIEAHPTD